MNSTPAARRLVTGLLAAASSIGLKRYFRFECRGLRNRTPSPVPFGSKNSMPADFKSMPYRRFIGERNWNFAINDFDTTDRCNSNFGGGRQIEGCPPQHGPSCAHLSTREFFCHLPIDLF